VTAGFADLHKSEPFYTTLAGPSIDPEFMIRMLIVGYCFGIQHERQLCQEVALHMAYRWFL
jgi:transposase